MAETQDIVFDADSGISAEEQQEILSAINGIAEKNRRSLSTDAVSQKGKINAKKSGAVFPLAVNIAALAVLCAGAFLLIYFNGKTDALVRTGNAVYNLTERALIEEIRKDTAQKIAAKENEISTITSRLKEVDAQLMQLQSGAEDLTAEQLAAQERLLALQTAYREELFLLQEERSQILEASRSREAKLRSQLEERTRELTAVKQTTSEELERLTNEQQSIAAIDAQFAGGLAFVSSYVQNGQYAEAVQVIESLQFFLNNNSLSFARSFQARKEIYNKAADSLVTVIEEMRKFRSVNSEGLELYERNIKLEEAAAEMQKTIDAFTSGSSAQTNRLKELEDSASVLRSSVASLETSVSEKDRAISSLETEKSQLTRSVADLQAVNATREQEIINLRNQLAIIRQALQE